MSLPIQHEIFLMSFENNGVEYRCYKMDNDEVYFVKPICLQGPKTRIRQDPEVYMSRMNYESFLKEKNIIP